MARCRASCWWSARSRAAVTVSRSSSRSAREGRLPVSPSIRAPRLLDGGGSGGGPLLGCHRLLLQSRQAGGVGRKGADGLLGVAAAESEIGRQLDPLLGERLDVGAAEALAAARLRQAGGQSVVLAPVAAGVAESRHRLERGQPGVEAGSRGGPADPGLHGLSGGPVTARLVAQLGVLRLTIGEAGVLDLQLPPPDREPGCLIDGRQRGGRRLEQHLDPAAGGRPCGRAQTRLAGQGQTAVDRGLQLLTGAHLLGAVHLDDGGLLPALRLEAAGRRQAGSEPLQTGGAQIHPRQAAGQLRPRPARAPEGEDAPAGQRRHDQQAAGSEQDGRPVPAGRGQGGRRRSAQHRNRGEPPQSRPCMGAGGPRRGDQGHHRLQLGRLDTSQPGDRDLSPKRLAARRGGHLLVAMGERRRNVDPAPQGTRRGGLPLADPGRLRHRLETGGDLGSTAAEGAERFLDGGPARLRLCRRASRLVQLSSEGDDRGLALGGEAGVRRLALQGPGQLGRLLGGPPHLRRLGVQLGDAAADPVALGCHGRLRGELRLHLELAKPRLLAGKRGEPALCRLDLALEAARLGDRDAQGAGDPPFGTHPLECIRQLLGGLGGGRPFGAGVDQPLERLTQASCLLGGRFGRGELQALLAEPGGGAEDRLVDPEVESARAHRAPDPKPLGDVTTAQLLHLGLDPVPVEGLGHPETLPAIQPVGEGQTESP